MAENMGQRVFGHRRITAGRFRAHDWDSRQIGIGKQAIDTGEHGQNQLEIGKRWQLVELGPADRQILDIFGLADFRPHPDFKPRQAPGNGGPPIPGPAAQHIHQQQRHGLNAFGAQNRRRGAISGSCYFIVGMTNSAPARMPVGQRWVIVLRRV